MAVVRKLAFVMLAGAWACGSGKAPVTGAIPEHGVVVSLDNGDTVSTVQPDSAVAVAAALVDTATAEAAMADSAADEAALTALEQLEIGSLDRGAALRLPVTVPSGEPVSGTDVEKEANELFNAPRGGAAAAAAATYDIDVAGFSSHRQVQAYVNFFLGPARERFTIWLGRLARYEGHVRNRFRAQGIPEDMVYLGLIESGFSNTAVSRAKAVGMWQFMPVTGSRYGLKFDQWVDDRRDPFKATDAAARHLADLNNAFGSWWLAAAAYNGGAGRVSRGIRRIGTDSVSDDTFFTLSARRYLRPETRDYVPKLIAAALIAKNPTRYGFDSIPALQPLSFDEITVSEQTGLDVLAELADTTTAAMMELNPQFYRGVTPPRRTVIVRVPRGSGTVVAQRWAELPANERVTVIEHVVARGETVSGIAKRYRVTTSLILAANPRVRPRSLRIGQRLIIPISPAAQARGGRAVARSTTVRQATPAASPRRPANGAHTVKWGESLWTISQRYGVTVGDLRRWNDLADDHVLKPGYRLVVVKPDAAPAAAADEAAAAGESR